MAITAFAGLVMVLASSYQPEASNRAEQLLTSYNAAQSASPLMRRALETFLEVEDAYWRGDYGNAQAALDGIWKTAPAGSQAWALEYRKSAQVSDQTGINIGTPGGYYALRMYEECLRWRKANPKPNPPVTTATLSVVLVGQSEGLQPRTQAELEAKTGVKSQGQLDAKLMANKERMILESTQLFQEYMRAASDGKMAVEVNFVSLPTLKVPVSVDGRFAGLTGSAYRDIWAAVPQNAKAKTDWWWVVYPSHVPEQHPDFKTTEFITGGMGTGPDGVSPCFISDDRWIVRKPPHLGRGDYTTIERRAYLPQWLQHEMAHHWFRTWPEFKLEEKDHQWFNRSTWPSDFSGQIEPDYYAEAMRLRLQPLANPPLHIGLLYAPPSPDTLSKIDTQEIVGKYQRIPVENNWHMGEIKLQGGGYLWQNAAGKSWRLTLDKASGVLRTGPDCPYTPDGEVEGPPFSFSLSRGADGRHSPRLLGFSFNGGLYTRVAQQ